MGNAGSGGSEKGRRMISQLLAKPIDDDAAGRKKMISMFNLYDSNKDGRLGWAEAKQYISDLLELSGMQAVAIREAREMGQTDISRWYNSYLREIFDLMDTDKDGYISIEEMVRPGRENISQLLQAVSAKVKEPTSAPQNKLVLSSKLKEENISTVLNTPNSSPCVTGCGFYGTPENYGYCNSCIKLLSEPAVRIDPADLEPDSVEVIGGNDNNNNSSKSSGNDNNKPPAVVPPPASTAPVSVVAVAVEEDSKRKPKNVADTKTKKKDDDDSQSSGEDGHNEDTQESIEEDGFLEVSSASRHSKFTVLDGDQVEKLMARKIRDASELLGLSDDEAALVLMFFAWNFGRLQEQYFLNVDKYRVSAGIDMGNSYPQKVTGGDCSICFDSVNISETAALNCGHGPFCKACYADYLSQKVHNFGASGILRTGCMGQGCPLILSPLHWKRLANPPDYDRYRYFYIKEFVESTSNLGFCPNPSCTKVVKFSGLGRPADVVECMCGQKYCFSCCAEAHNPNSCDQLRLWNEKNNSDTESMKYIMATSKQCPHCHMATERNEGCNHMTCRKEVGGCGGQWCWMCRGDWSTHGEKTGGYFSCNLYDKSAGKKLDDAAGSTLAEAEYFQHFCDRFMNHGQLEKDAEKKKEECITVWMVKYREESGGLDPTFLLEALELLVNCRHTLKMTYVYAWFQDQAIKQKKATPSSSSSAPANNAFTLDLQNRLKKLDVKLKKRGKGNNPAGAAAMARAEGVGGLLEAQKELFDFQQASLEGVTESLGELLFSGKVVEKAGELKNLTRTTKQLRTNWYLHNLVSAFEDAREDMEDE